MRAIAIVAGSFVVLATMGSAVRTVILPRGVPARLGRRVFRTSRWFFELRAGRNAPYERRDRIMALYAPVTLLLLLLTWLALVAAGFTAIFWGLDVHDLRGAVETSGSSLLTLGFQHPGDMPGTILAFVEAALGLILLALLIAYLPTIYSAFQRREQLVAMLEVRAGSPPSPVEMFRRFVSIGWLDRMPELWARWEVWFVDLEESHTSFPALTFFRSPQPHHSWVTASGAVLDAASIAASTLDRPRDPDAELCIRAGYIALRRIASFFTIPYDPAPSPDDPISITREEYDEVYDTLVGLGIPVKADREQAWRDFAGWRVNYDTVLVALARFTIAPPAVWSTDRIERLGDDAVARPLWRRARSRR